jgi:hypothetical protein
MKYKAALIQLSIAAKLEWCSPVKNECHIFEAAILIAIAIDLQRVIFILLITSSLFLRKRSLLQPSKRPALLWRTRSSG